MIKFAELKTLPLRVLAKMAVGFAQAIEAGQDSREMLERVLGIIAKRADQGVA